MSSAIDVLDQMIELEFIPPAGGIFSNEEWEAKWQSFSGLRFTLHIKQTAEGWAVSIGSTQVMLEATDDKTIKLTRLTKIGQPVVFDISLEINTLEKAIEDHDFDEMLITAEDCITQAIYRKLYDIALADANGEKLKPDAKTLIEDAAIETEQSVASMNLLNMALPLMTSEFSQPKIPYNAKNTISYISWAKACEMMGIFATVSSSPEDMVFFRGKCFVVKVLKGTIRIDHHIANETYIHRIVMQVKGSSLEIELQDFATHKDEPDIIAEASLLDIDVKSGNWNQAFLGLGLKPKHYGTQELMLQCGLERLQRSMLHAAEAMENAA